MSTSEQELELLRLKLRILELEKERMQMESLGHVTLDKNSNEPAPLAVPTGKRTGYITREELNKMSPGELFVLAKKKGISIENIFPI